MKIIEKIKFKVKKKKVREIKLFGISIIRYKLIKYKNRFFKNKLFFLPINYHKKSKQVFYLKINRNDDIAYSIFQQWIDIVHYINAEYYILCDKDDIKQQIYKRINFHDYDIKFIKSDYVCLKNIVKQLTNKIWFNAGCAHLTTFKHSQNKYNSFWNIDADDTMFCMNADDAANIMKSISDYADKNNIDVFSLDMHHSRTHGKHWSFGITLINTKTDWFSIFENNKNTDWRTRYLNYDYDFNLDWFFTYLRDNNIAKIETFYIENSYFIHYGDFLYNSIGSGVYYWINKRLKFPILLEIFGSKVFGNIPISKNCIKFNYNLEEKTAHKFMCTYQTYIDIPSLPRNNMWLVEDEVIKV